jgi:hypothetical protein
MSYYQTGAISFDQLKSAAEKIADKVRAELRKEAAKGAAPAAKKSVAPMVVGVAALSTLALVVALRK